jgi:hypothetical protein
MVFGFRVLVFLVFWVFWVFGCFGFSFFSRGRLMFLIFLFTFTPFALGLLAWVNVIGSTDSCFFIFFGFPRFRARGELS